PAAVYADNSKPAVDVWGSRSALAFEANNGQTNAAVRYLARTSNGVLFFTDRGVLFSGQESAAGFELAGENPAARWEPLDPTGRIRATCLGRVPALRSQRSGFSCAQARPQTGAIDRPGSRFFDVLWRKRGRFRDRH